MSREIEQPYRRALTAPGSLARRGQHGASRERCGGRGPACARSAAPRRADRSAPEERGAVFLRADRLEGNADKTHRGLRQGRAAHASRDRARRLAAVRRGQRRDLGQGRRHAAQGARLDQRSRGQVPARARDRLLRPAALLPLRERRARRGQGDPLRRPRPVRGDARRSTRAALRPTTTGTCAATRSRSTSCARSAPRATRACTSSACPVMYTPWLEFPLSERAQVRVPHADHRVDADSRLRGRRRRTTSTSRRTTTRRSTPRIMTRRGVQIAGQGRYLFRAGGGRGASPRSCRTTGITDDTRWAFSWKHNQQFLPWLTGYVNYNRVSDATYLADFADRIVGDVAEDAAGGSGARSRRTGRCRRARARAVVPDAAGSEPCRRGHTAVQHAAAGEGGAERVRLAGPHLERARRVRALLAVRARSDRRSRHVLSVAALDSPGQRVVRQRARRRSRRGSTTSTSPRPACPTVAPASRCRSRAWTRVSCSSATRRSSAASFVQTLEPRAMYTYIPFRNQNQLPVFDTVLDDFNFTQLFSENRFIGGDRVGDTNQLALAVTSRLLDPATGAERFRFAVGQRFYFEDQQVNLPGTTPQKAGLVRLPGRRGRPALGCVVADRPHAIRLRNVAGRSLQPRHALQPAPGKVLSLIYRYSRELVDQVGGQSELKQTYLSGAVAAVRQLDLRGRVELLLSRPQDAGGGRRAGVQWRVLGAARRRTAADHDHRDANQLDLRAARAQWTGARGYEPPRASAAHGSRVTCARTIRRSSSATAASIPFRNSDERKYDGTAAVF